MMSQSRFRLMGQKRLEAGHDDNQWYLGYLGEYLGSDTDVHFRKTSYSIDFSLLEPFVDERRVFYLVPVAWAPDHNCIRSC